MAASPDQQFDEEVHRIVELEAELKDAFPHLDEVTIRRAVGHIWNQYNRAPVRDFVPLLVRRQAFTELRSPTLPLQRTARGSLSAPATVVTSI